MWPEESENCLNGVYVGKTRKAFVVDCEAQLPTLSGGDLQNTGSAPCYILQYTASHPAQA